MMKLKMLYDGWFFHLEKSDQATLEKAYPELERTCEELDSRVERLVGDASQADEAFKLVLTEVRGPFQIER